MASLTYHLFIMRAFDGVRLALRRGFPTTPAAQNCRRHAAAHSKTPRCRLFQVGEGGVLWRS